MDRNQARQLAFTFVKGATVSSLVCFWGPSSPEAAGQSHIPVLWFLNFYLATGIFLALVCI